MINKLDRGDLLYDHECVASVKATLNRCDILLIG